MALTQVNGGMLDSVAQQVGFRNRIINGAMMIDQRNAGASVTLPASVTYTIDRWYVYSSQASKLTAQQNAGSVTPPAGFRNYLGITTASAYSVGSGEVFWLNQPIEGLNASDLGWGTANAATVTLSFKVYSSLTGSFGGAIRNGAGNRSYPFSFTVSAANTWTTVAVTIPGDTTGTWATDNTGFCYVTFSLGAGSTFSGTANSWQAGNLAQPTGSVSVVGTNGATFYITGVQLEKGSTATSFDYRPYGTELALCQRYYYRQVQNDAVTTGTFLTGVCGSATDLNRCFVGFPVRMRASPTFGYGGSLRAYDGVSTSVITSIGANVCSQTSASVNLVASGGGLTTGRPAMIIENNTSAYCDYSAEL